MDHYLSYEGPKHSVVGRQRCQYAQSDLKRHYKISCIQILEGHKKSRAQSDTQKKEHIQLQSTTQGIVVEANYRENRLILSYSSYNNSCNMRLDVAQAVLAAVQGGIVQSQQQHRLKLFQLQGYHMNQSMRSSLVDSDKLLQMSYTNSMIQLQKSRDVGLEREHLPH